MRNIKFLISYNGANYFGFQKQPSSPTIQGEIESALTEILREKTSINGCSRTDTGVHAKEYCFNVHINNSIPISGLEKAMNQHLPPDICVLDCQQTSNDFHARFDALEKEYLYIINNSNKKDVFKSRLELHYLHALNVEQLNSAAQLFMGEHDFSAFCRAESKARLNSTKRTIHSIKISRQEERVSLFISGNGFLHNMVRIIVGTLIYYAEGKRTLTDIKQALKTGERNKAGFTAPPHGLYLNRVRYKDGSYVEKSK
ncbi:MAG: tRNA pseudouridine(38-40) synthase TruA [Oscillospiraceae bacterium]|nr:tRNA pseudouridine(38-40) synthase TruA [Oscillospiraceae bacterium]